MSERKLSRINWGIATMLLVALSAGCTHVYAPKQTYIDAGKVPAIKVAKAVKITNVQTSTQNQHIAQMGIHAYVGSLQKWTDTAVGVMQKELERQGMTGAADGSKELKVKVISARGYQTAFTVQCIVQLEVETAGGYRKTFEAKAGSGLTLFRACSGAVTRSVEAALKDEKIRAYIAK